MLSKLRDLPSMFISWIAKFQYISWLQTLLSTLLKNLKSRQSSKIRVASQIDMKSVKFLNKNAQRKESQVWKKTKNSVLLALLSNSPQSVALLCKSRIIPCLVILELWLPDMYSFVVFLLWQKTNLTIFKRNCFTLVLRILITIIPAAVLNRHKIIYAPYKWLRNIRMVP